MRKFYVCLVILALTALGLALEPSITFNKAVDYAPHAVIGNNHGACPRASGGILFVDGYDDYVIQVATPLTTDGSTNDATNSLGVYRAFTTVFLFGSGMSYQAITYDGTFYYASGYNGTGTCNLFQLTDTGVNPYTVTKLTVSPDGGYSGVTAVAANTLVMPEFDTGGIQFFSVSGATATANGSAIANPNVGTYKTSQAYFYDDGIKKWIFTYMVDTSLTRRIDVFETDGTPGGTTYKGTFCPAIATDMGVTGINGTKFGNLTCNSANKVLVAAAAVAGAGPNGFDVFSINSVSFNGTASPYLQIRDALFSSNATKLTTGAAFFNSNANLALIGGNDMLVYDVAPGTGVNDWNLY